MKLEQLLANADAEGWIFVGNASPEPKQRVLVMHVFARSYDCSGQIDADGRWQCSNGFILPNMHLTFQPTHWRPLSETINQAIEAQRPGGAACRNDGANDIADLLDEARAALANASSNALIAAAQASEAVTELLRYHREGPQAYSAFGDVDVVEKLAEAVLHSTPSRGEWRWYFGADDADDEMCECASRDAAIAQGMREYQRGEQFYIVEARMLVAHEVAMGAGRRDTAPFAETRSGEFITVGPKP